MKKIISFTLMFFTTATLFAEAGFGTSSDSPDGREWTFIVGPIDKRDKWDSSVSEHPPLSPKKAKDLAVAFMKRVPVKYEDQAWNLKSITLLPISTKKKSTEHWTYAVKFTTLMYATGKHTTRQYSFTVLVRLDGTIPKPEITEKEEIE